MIVRPGTQFFARSTSRFGLAIPVGWRGSGRKSARQTQVLAQKIKSLKTLFRVSRLEQPSPEVCSNTEYDAALGLGMARIGHTAGLDMFDRGANAGRVKLWVALSLALVLVTVTAAQEPPREYLVRMADANFPDKLRVAGISPLHHSGQIWAVRASDEKVLSRNTELQDVTPATVVVIELQPGAKNASRMIEDAGGIVFRTYRSAPLIAAIIPTKKIGELQRLPGIKRINKSRFYEPFRAPSD